MSVTRQANIKQQSFGQKKVGFAFTRGFDSSPSSETEKNEFTQYRKDVFNKVENPKVKNVVVEYDPGALSRDEVQKTLHEDGAPENIQDAALSRKAKHRSVTSSVTCYGNSFCEEVKPFSLVVTTSAATNFREVDGSFDANLYKSIMKLSFKRWLSAQDKMGVKVVIVPPIPDVNLKKLSHLNKSQAKKAIAIALKEALEESTFKNISEVVFALPDVGGKSDEYDKITAQYSDYNGATTLTVANVDVFDAAKEISSANVKVGLINPGSDTAMGGGFKQTAGLPQTPAMKPLPKHPTLEEAIFNLTDAAYIQTIEKNEALKDVIYQEYDPSLQVAPKPVPAPEPAPALTIATDGFDKDAINKRINLLSDDSLDKIRKACGKDWAVTKDASGKFADATHNVEKQQAFKVTATQLSTVNNNVETFVAMIKAFRAVHPDKKMTMMVDSAAKANLETACKMANLNPEKYKIVEKGGAAPAAPAPTPTVKP